jgi:hypothetical protein
MALSVVIIAVEPVVDAVGLARQIDVETAVVSAMSLAPRIAQSFSEGFSLAFSEQLSAQFSGGLAVEFALEIAMNEYESCIQWVLPLPAVSVLISCNRPW